MATGKNFVPPLLQVVYSERTPFPEELFTGKLIETQKKLIRNGTKCIHCILLQNIIHKIPVKLSTPLLSYLEQSTSRLLSIAIKTGKNCHKCSRELPKKTVFATENVGWAHKLDVRAENLLHMQDWRRPSPACTSVHYRQHMFSMFGDILAVELVLIWQGRISLGQAQAGA